MSRWILAALLFSACLPRASVADAGHSVCTATAPCPFFSCSCDDGGVTYRASRCVESCSDEAATCGSACSVGAGGEAPDLGGDTLVWSATLTAGVGQFYGASGRDRSARDAAAALCRKAGVPSSECANGSSAVALERYAPAICSATYTLSSNTFSYDGPKGSSRTDAKALAVGVCIDAMELAGPNCGLGQFSCTGG